MRVEASKTWARHPSRESSTQSLRFACLCSVLEVHTQGLGHAEHVLVAAAAEVYEDDVVLRPALAQLHGVVQGVGGLQGGDDALRPGDELHGVQGLAVRDRDVLHAAGVLEVGVLWPDAGVVQACTDGVRLGDLPVAGLQEVGPGAVQDARRPGGQRGRVGLMGVAIRPGSHHGAPGLHAVDLHGLVLEEGREHADGVGAAADTGHHGVRQAAGAVGEGRVLGGLVEHLRPGLVADDRLEVPDDVREGVRAHGGADDVVRGPYVGDPVAHGLVDRVLEGLGATLRRHHLGAEHLHAEDVQRLAFHVHGAHVDDALQTQQGAGRRRGHAVLARAGLRDDPGLAQALCQQRLAQGVVDLVRAGVGQLLALEPKLGTPKLLREVLCEVERRRPAHELRPEAGQLGDEGGVDLRLVPGGAELLVGLHERLGDVAAAELAEVPLALLLERVPRAPPLAVLVQGLGCRQGPA
mmetsp:Transcript_19189/g.60366  ORF Transcript_19189/g.60366 Transcript_19189/m.60366 type:complete len:466 (-) Transcript_19189:822-2219(-)